MQREQLDLFRHLKAIPRPTPGGAAAPTSAASPPVASREGALATLGGARPAPGEPGGHRAVQHGAVPPSPEALRAPRAVASREELLLKADRVARVVSSELGVPVRLRVTDNRSTMVSYKRQERSLALRLHHMFLDAPPEVLQALADYAGRGKGAAGKVLDGFIHQAQERIRAGRRKGAPLAPAGRHFELKSIFDRMNEAHFQGGIRASIGWGRPTTKRRRRTIRLGVYDHHAREIRIHPSLDRPDVPLFFVEYIVFHEMLHQLFPSSRTGGRAVHHPRAFRDRERAYAQYALAIAWEKQHLEKLLRR